jgi:tetratricopeptide (TPR) repeat protein
MANPAVSEEEIEKAEILRADGATEASLALSQELLERVDDGDLRMRLLFNIVTCSSWLDRGEVAGRAMAELDKMPDPQFSRVLANMERGYAEEILGRPENALAIFDTILETGYFDREDFRVHKYTLCLYKGQALLGLKRASDALEWLDRGHAIYPSEESAPDETARRIFGWVEPLIQTNRANCLMVFDRFEEAFQAASEALRLSKGDLATFAMEQMAECRHWQARVPEALELYLEVKKRLPCRLVDEKRNQTGITNCMIFLEGLRGSSQPS